MDITEADGQYDLDGDGLRRSRQGRVGDDLMACHVATMGGETLLLFWRLNGQQQRFLIDAQKRRWLDDERVKAIRQATKYDATISKILQAQSN